MLILLCLGILLPKATAVIAAAMPGTFSQIVICTGGSIQTITIGPSGEPVDTAPMVSEPCVLALVDPAAPTPEPFWHALARRYAVVLPRDLTTVSLPRFARLHPARAPPLGPV